jgi:hypothetical protein
LEKEFVGLSSCSVSSFSSFDGKGTTGNGRPYTSYTRASYNDAKGVSVRGEYHGVKRLDFVGYTNKVLHPLSVRPQTSYTRASYNYANGVSARGGFSVRIVSTSLLTPEGVRGGRGV